MVAWHDNVDAICLVGVRHFIWDAVECEGWWHVTGLEQSVLVAKYVHFHVAHVGSGYRNVGTCFIIVFLANTEWNQCGRLNKKMKMDFWKLTICRLMSN